MTTRLLPFHADVLSEVFFFLDLRSLSQCARVNSAFYTTAIPQLYRSIRVDLEEDTDALMFFMRSHRAAIMSGQMSMTSAPRSVVSVLSELADPRLGLDLRDLVKHVDLDTHQITTCEGTDDELPDLLHLRSVRLTLHQSSILHDVQYYSLHPWDFSACSVLTHLSIPKLVLRNVPLLYGRPSQNLAPKSALERCEEVVLSLFPDQAVVGTNMKFEDPACGLSGLLRAVPCSARKVTLVFWTDPKGEEHGPGQVWRPSPRPRRDGEGSMLETSWVGRFFNQLAEKAKEGKMAFTVVNAGNVDPHAILETGDHDHSEKHVQEIVQDFVRGTVEVNKIRFVRMREYMRSAEAEGVFDDQESKLWM